MFLSILLKAGTKSLHQKNFMQVEELLQDL